MSSTPNHRMISAMQVTLDGYVLDVDGACDWVDSWADGLDLLPRVDAYLLGGGMFADYEEFWTSILDDPAAIAGSLGRDLYDREVAYAERAVATPHLVLSTTLTTTSFPSARIVRALDEVAALREQPGAVYVVGGPRLVGNLLDADLLDELHLIVHPVTVGRGTPLFGSIRRRHDLALASSAPLPNGRVHLSYEARSSR